MTKVIITREGCTSCGTCWDMCPEFFEENPDDSLSQVREEYRIGGNPAEGNVPPDMEECVREAADACPVEVILVED